LDIIRRTGNEGLVDAKVSRIVKRLVPLLNEDGQRTKEAS